MPKGTCVVVSNDRHQGLLVCQDIHGIATCSTVILIAEAGTHLRSNHESSGVKVIDGRAVRVTASGVSGVQVYYCSNAPRAACVCGDERDIGESSRIRRVYADLLVLHSAKAQPVVLEDGNPQGESTLPGAFSLPRRASPLALLLEGSPGGLVGRAPRDSTALTRRSGGRLGAASSRAASGWRRLRRLLTGRSRDAGTHQHVGAVSSSGGAGGAGGASAPADASLLRAATWAASAAGVPPAAAATTAASSSGAEVAADASPVSAPACSLLDAILQIGLRTQAPASAELTRAATSLNPLSHVMPQHAPVTHPRPAQAAHDAGASSTGREAPQPQPESPPTSARSHHGLRQQLQLQHAQQPGSQLQLHCPAFPFLEQDLLTRLAAAARPLMPAAPVEDTALPQPVPPSTPPVQGSHVPSDFATGQCEGLDEGRNPGALGEHVRVLQPLLYRGVLPPYLPCVAIVSGAPGQECATDNAANQARDTPEAAENWRDARSAAAAVGPAAAEPWVGPGEMQPAQPPPPPQNRQHTALPTGCEHLLERQGLWLGLLLSGRLALPPPRQMAASASAACQAGAAGTVASGSMERTVSRKSDPPAGLRARWVGALRSASLRTRSSGGGAVQPRGGDAGEGNVRPRALQTDQAGLPSPQALGGSPVERVSGPGARACNSTVQAQQLQQLESDVRLALQAAPHAETAQAPACTAWCFGALSTRRPQQAPPPASERSSPGGDSPSAQPQRSRPTSHRASAEWRASVWAALRGTDRPSRRSPQGQGTLSTHATRSTADGGLIRGAVSLSGAVSLPRLQPNDNDDGDDQGGTRLSPSRLTAPTPRGPLARMRTGLSKATRKLRGAVVPGQRSDPGALHVVRQRLDGAAALDPIVPGAEHRASDGGGFGYDDSGGVQVGRPHDWDPRLRTGRYMEEWEEAGQEEIHAAGGGNEGVGGEEGEAEEEEEYYLLGASTYGGSLSAVAAAERALVAAIRLRQQRRDAAEAAAAAATAVVVAASMDAAVQQRRALRNEAAGAAAAATGGGGESSRPPTPATPCGDNECFTTDAYATQSPFGRRFSHDGSSSAAGHNNGHGTAVALACASSGRLPLTHGSQLPPGPALQQSRHWGNNPGCPDALNSPADNGDAAPGVSAFALPTALSGVLPSPQRSSNGTASGSTAFPSAGGGEPAGSIAVAVTLAVALQISGSSVHERGRAASHATAPEGSDGRGSGGKASPRPSPVAMLAARGLPLPSSIGQTAAPPRFPAFSSGSDTSTFAASGAELNVSVFGSAHDAAGSNHDGSCSPDLSAGTNISAGLVFQPGVPRTGSTPALNQAFLTPQLSPPPPPPPPSRLHQQQQHEEQLHQQHAQGRTPPGGFGAYAVAPSFAAGSDAGPDTTARPTLPSGPDRGGGSNERLMSFLCAGPEAAASASHNSPGIRTLASPGYAPQPAPPGLPPRPAAPANPRCSLLAGPETLPLQRWPSLPRPQVDAAARAAPPLLRQCHSLSRGGEAPAPVTASRRGSGGLGRPPLARPAAAASARYSRPLVDSSHSGPVLKTVTGLALASSRLSNSGSISPIGSGIRRTISGCDSPRGGGSVTSLPRCVNSPRCGDDGGYGNGAAAAAGGDGGKVLCSRALDRYAALTATSPGWKYTAMYDKHDAMLLARLSSARISQASLPCNDGSTGPSGGAPSARAPGSELSPSFAAIGGGGGGFATASACAVGAYATGILDSGMSTTLANATSNNRYSFLTGTYNGYRQAPSAVRTTPHGAVHLSTAAAAVDCEGPVSWSGNPAYGAGQGCTGPGLLGVSRHAAVSAVAASSAVLAHTGSAPLPLPAASAPLPDVACVRRARTSVSSGSNLAPAGSMSPTHVYSGAGEVFGGCCDAEALAAAETAAAAAGRPKISSVLPARMYLSQPVTATMLRSMPEDVRYSCRQARSAEAELEEFGVDPETDVHRRALRLSLLAEDDCEEEEEEEQEEGTGQPERPRRLQGLAHEPLASPFSDPYGGAAAAAAATVPEGGAQVAPSWDETLQVLRRQAISCVRPSRSSRPSRSTHRLAALLLGPASRDGGRDADARRAGSGSASGAVPPATTPRSSALVGPVTAPGAAGPDSGGGGGNGADSGAAGGGIMGLFSRLTSRGRKSTIAYDPPSPVTADVAVGARWSTPCMAGNDLVGGSGGGGRNVGGDGGGGGVTSYGGAGGGVGTGLFRKAASLPRSVDCLPPTLQFTQDDQQYPQQFQMQSQGQGQGDQRLQAAHAYMPPRRCATLAHMQAQRPPAVRQAASTAAGGPVAVAPRPGLTRFSSRATIVGVAAGSGPSSPPLVVLTERGTSRAREPQSPPLRHAGVPRRQLQPPHWMPLPVQQQQLQQQQQQQQGPGAATAGPASPLADHPPHAGADLHQVATLSTGNGSTPSTTLAGPWLLTADCALFEPDDLYNDAARVTSTHAHLLSRSDAHASAPLYSRHPGLSQSEISAQDDFSSTQRLTLTQRYATRGSSSAEIPACLPEERVSRPSPAAAARWLNPPSRMRASVDFPVTAPCQGSPVSREFRDSGPGGHEGRDAPRPRGGEGLGKQRAKRLSLVDWGRGLGSFVFRGSGSASNSAGGAPASLEEHNSALHAQQVEAGGEQRQTRGSRTSKWRRFSMAVLHHRTDSTSRVDESALAGDSPRPSRLGSPVASPQHPSRLARSRPMGQSESGGKLPSARRSAQSPAFLMQQQWSPLADALLSSGGGSGGWEGRACDSPQKGQPKRSA